MFVSIKSILHLGFAHFWIFRLFFLYRICNSKIMFVWIHADYDKHLGDFLNMILKVLTLILLHIYPKFDIYDSKSVTSYQIIKLLNIVTVSM